MSNTSATGGYLVPLNNALTEDEINDLWQSVVCGVTGLPGELVRPRWQPIAPMPPAPEVDWCAIGVTEYPDGDGYSGITHNPEGEGTNTVTTDERMIILASFYGPHASDNARLFRDGLNISQNRGQLRKAGFALQWATPPVPAPELVNGLWRKRSDVTITAILETKRDYAVLNATGNLTFIETDIVPAGSESGTIPLGNTATCGRRE